MQKRIFSIIIVSAMLTMSSIHANLFKFIRNVNEQRMAKDLCLQASESLTMINYHLKTCTNQACDHSKLWILQKRYQDIINHWYPLIKTNNSTPLKQSLSETSSIKTAPLEVTDSMEICSSKMMAEPTRATLIAPTESEEPAKTALTLALPKTKEPAKTALTLALPEPKAFIDRFNYIAS